MAFTGGLTYEETGFVYGMLQNPTLTLNDGKVTTDSPVNTKGGQLTAAVSGSALAYGVNYYARAYAMADDGTVIYSDQSTGFGVDAAQYGVFSVTNSGKTFTITRSDGTDGSQTVYYRTVNGSAIGGTHFEYKAGSVTFAVGETTKSVMVTEKTCSVSLAATPPLRIPMPTAPIPLKFTGSAAAPRSTAVRKAPPAP